MSQEYCPLDKALKVCKNDIAMAWDTLVDTVREEWDKREEEHQNEIDNMEKSNDEQ